MMIDTSPWPSCSSQSPWLPCSSHTISSTGPSVSPFRDFSLQIWQQFGLPDLCGIKSKAFASHANESPVFRGQLRTWGGNSPRGGFLPPLKVFYEGGGDFSPPCRFSYKGGGDFSPPYRLQILVFWKGEGNCRSNILQQFGQV